MFNASFAGFGGAMYITAVKSIFAFITRGPTAFAMSFCGGVLSTAVLCIMIKHIGKNLSYIGVGVLCAAAHNLGQLLCACAVSGTIMLLNYGKYLLIFALISGTLTGLILNIIMPKLERFVPKKIQNNKL
jgi:heptaprenyl diphosphate synthase